MNTFKNWNFGFNTAQPLLNASLQLLFVYDKKKQYVYTQVIIFKRSQEGWSASHLIFSSKPHSVHFLDRATSKCSSFNFSILNVLYDLSYKKFLKIRPR